MQNKYTKKMLKGFMFVSISLAGCSKSTGQLGIEERAKGLTLDKKLMEKESIEASKATMVKVDLEAQVKECLDNKVSVEPSLKKPAEEEEKRVILLAPIFALCGTAVGVLGGAIIGPFYLEDHVRKGSGYETFGGMFFGALGGFYVGTMVGFVVDSIRKKRRIETGWQDRYVTHQVM